MFKKLISLTILIAVLIPNFAFASFKDVTEESKYYNAVKYLEEKGAINSYKNENFNLNDKITKPEFLKIILTESDVEVSKKSVYTGFKDIKKNAWYAPYVKKALDLGIITKSDNFYPTKTVKKGEALEMIFKLKGIGISKIFKKETTFQFKDIQRGSRYAGIAKAAEQKHLFDGETIFKPFQQLERGEIAEILYKLDSSQTSQNSFALDAITIQINTPQGTNGITTNGKFPILLNVWDSILNSYLEKDKITENELLYGAINGMVEKLNDPYSSFQEPLEADLLQTSLNGDFEGIGVIVDMIENQFTVVTPLPGSPAEKAGLQPGDIITHINGEDITNATIELIINKIKGPAGTSVALKIKRDGKSLTVKIIRSKITMEAVSGEMQESSKIGIITITSFTMDTAQTFQDVANDLISRGARGLIIDLRNNPGGFLDSVVDMLHHYVPKGASILSVEYGNGLIETVDSNGPGDFANIKTVVLVNDGTASAAEIFAGVLQDYKLGTVIGITTFGKGTVQQLVNYTDGSMLKLTIAKWLTAKMRSIQGKGIDPDINLADNPNTTKDEIMDRALQQF